MRLFTKRKLVVLIMLYKHLIMLQFMISLGSYKVLVKIFCELIQSEDYLWININNFGWIDQLR